MIRMALLVRFCLLLFFVTHSRYYYWLSELDVDKDLCINDKFPLVNKHVISEILCIGIIIIYQNRNALIILSVDVLFHQNNFNPKELLCCELYLKQFRTKLNSGIINRTFPKCLRLYFTKTTSDIMSIFSNRLRA